MPPTPQNLALLRDAVLRLRPGARDAIEVHFADHLYRHGERLARTLATR